jgi:hypothetical protein
MALDVSLTKVSSVARGEEISGGRNGWGSKSASLAALPLTGKANRQSNTARRHSTGMVFWWFKRLATALLPSLKTP